MSGSTTLKNLAMGAVAATISVAGQSALAHTGIKDQGTEGKGLYTAATITHGCTVTDAAPGTPGATPLPVVAQSILFPNAKDSVAYRIKADGKDGPEIDLAKIITGADGGVLTLSPGGIQDKNVFNSTKEIEVTETDPTTGQPLVRVRGISFTAGKLDPTLVGVIPFRVGGISFNAASCAKSLLVRVAIGNWCTKSQDIKQDRRADIWIGHMTPLFNDPGVMPHDFETSPFWPTLTINRDLVANPLKPSCGAGFDVAVQPSDTDIDALLPIKGYWPTP